MAPILRSTIPFSHSSPSSLSLSFANFFFSLVLSIGLSAGEIGHLETKKLARVCTSSFATRTTDIYAIYIYLAGVSQLIAPRSARTRHNSRYASESWEWVARYAETPRARLTTRVFVRPSVVRAAFPGSRVPVISALRAHMRILLVTKENQRTHCLENLRFQPLYT